MVLRPSARQAPVPVSRKNVGAQRWVIQRVKNSGTVVCARFVGLSARHAEEVAHVIERHQDHDDAAQRVD